MTSTTKPRILSIETKNFRCLPDSPVAFGPSTVIVGGSGTGKSTIVNVLRFLSDVVIYDLEDTIKRFGGFEQIAKHPETPVTVSVTGYFTDTATPDVPDHYMLRFGVERHTLTRDEAWSPATHGADARGFTLTGTTITYRANDATSGLAGTAITGLQLLTKFGGDMGADMAALGDALRDIRFVEIDLSKVQDVSRITVYPDHDPDTEGVDPFPMAPAPDLAEDGSNLAEVIFGMRGRQQRTLDDILVGMQTCYPWFRAYETVVIGGATTGAELTFHESGLARTPLSAAADGMVETLAVLTHLRLSGSGSFIVVDNLNGLDDVTSAEVHKAADAAAANGGQVILAGRSETLATTDSGYATVHRLSRGYPGEIESQSKQPD